MSSLSAAVSSSCLSSPTLEMAIANLGETPHGLHSAGPFCHWSSLQVDQSLHWFFNMKQSNPTVLHVVCSVWHNGGPHHNQQWLVEGFETFLSKKRHQACHLCSSHSATNRLAECSVQIMKEGLKKEKEGTMASRMLKCCWLTIPLYRVQLVCRLPNCCTLLDLLKLSVSWKSRAASTAAEVVSQ